MPATMHRFTVIAQAYASSQRISKTVEAWSDLHVLRLVSPELEDWGYYVASVEEQGAAQTAAIDPGPETLQRGSHPAPSRSIMEDML